MRTTTALPLLLTVTLALAGCADGADDTGTDPTTEPAADVTPVDAPLQTTPSAAAASGDLVAVTDVEVTGHEGFDRVVLTIGGEGEPGWDVRYEDEARAQGSGDEIEVAGDAVLRVTATGIALPPDAPAPPYAGPGRIEPASTTAVQEVVDGTVFEGQHTFYVGVDEERPYRVERRDDPQRIVLEVSTD